VIETSELDALIAEWATLRQRFDPRSTRRDVLQIAAGIKSAARDAARFEELDRLMWLIEQREEVGAAPTRKPLAAAPRGSGRGNLRLVGP
jgi:hypothetical protein